MVSVPLAIVAVVVLIPLAVCFLCVTRATPGNPVPGVSAAVAAKGADHHSDGDHDGLSADSQQGSIESVRLQRMLARHVSAASVDVTQLTNQ